MEIKVTEEFAIEIIKRMMKSKLPFFLEYTKNHTIIVASKKDLKAVSDTLGNLKLIIDSTGETK